MLYICDLTELDKKEYVIKYFDEIKEEVIVFKNPDNDIKIFSSICPHFGGQIIYHKIENRFRCKWHNWTFSAQDGECLTFPIKGKLNSYNFKVEPKNLSNYKPIIKDYKVYLKYDS
jgi:nitrite reductase/ring-hydroxylating ferredoxin subunit